MIFLRSAVFMLYLTALTLFFGTLSGFLILLPFQGRWKIITLWNRCIIGGAKIICGIRYRVKGRQYIADTNAIYLAKHHSAWETIYLPLLFKASSAYVHKRSLNYIPFFGWGLASTKQIPISRQAKSDAMWQVINIGSKRLSEGRNVILFPEGTRMPVGKKGRYKMGGARLAIHTGRDIIPVALNAGMCWPRQAFIKKPGLITISFGPPISPQGLSPNALTKKVEEWIEAEMRVLNPEVYTTKV